MSPVFAPGVKTSSIPASFSFGMSSAGITPPADDDHVVGAARPELLHDLREQRHVRARVAREPDGVGVLLDRGLRDLLGRLEQARVDHLEAGVAQRPRHHLGAAVVPVEARLRDDHPQLLGHVGESIDDLRACRPPEPRRIAGDAGARHPLREIRRRDHIAYQVAGDGPIDVLIVAAGLLEHRADLDASVVRSVPRGPRIVRPRRVLRPTWGRPLRPADGRSSSDAGDARSRTR